MKKNLIPALRVFKTVNLKSQQSFARFCCNRGRVKSQPKQTALNGHCEFQDGTRAACCTSDRMAFGRNLKENVQERKIEALF